MSFLKKILANQKGMSLVEVLASLALISIIAVTAIKISAQGLAFNAQAGKKSVAVNLAQDKIEEIKIQPWDTMSSVHTPKTLVILNNQEFKYTAKIEDVEPDKLRRVTVQVIWRTSVERDVYLSTLIAKPD